MRIASVGICLMLFLGFASAESPVPVDNQFTSWKGVPNLIDAIDEKDSRGTLFELHQLTRIKLGFPQSSRCLNDEEHRQYMLQTKQRWIHWWESTGKPVSKLRENREAVDKRAFELAREFLTGWEMPPSQISPVWIPSDWTLYVTFSNGDYMGRETELWIIDRSNGMARLSKLRGDYRHGGWNWGVTLKEYEDFSPERADRVLKALCYLHHDAPSESEEIADDKLEGLYYPHSTLRLRDGENRILWNTEGYRFQKSRPEYGNDDSGRSYYFLRTVFSDDEKWNVLTSPTSEALAPFRKFLSLSKPYSTQAAADVVLLFGKYGGSSEKRAMLEWADKQRLATDPDMDWRVCCDDFGSNARVNVMNFTRLKIAETLGEITKVGDRLAAKETCEGGGYDSDRVRERALERYVIEIGADKK